MTSAECSAGSESGRRRAAGGSTRNMLLTPSAKGAGWCGSATPAQASSLSELWLGEVAQEFSRRLTIKAIKPSEPARATNRAIVIYSQRWVVCNSRLCRSGSQPHTEGKHPAKPTAAGPCVGRARIRRRVQHLHQFPATTWGQGIHIGPSIGWILLCHVQLPSP